MKRFALLFLAAFAVGQEPDAVRPALDRADELMRDRSYGPAAEAYAEAAKRFPGTAGAQRAFFGRARALFLGGRYGDVLAEGARFLDRTPDDLWAPKMRFLMAEAFERLKSVKEAAGSWRERAEFLAGDGWRERITSHFLMLGDSAFEGKETKDEFGRAKRIPEFGRALDFYLKARGVRVPAARAEEIDYRVAACLDGTNQAAKAAEAFLRLPEDHPRGTLRAAALLRAGGAFFRAGEFPRGRAALEKIRKEMPDAPEAALALKALADEMVRQGGRLQAEGYERWRLFLSLHPDHGEAAAVALAWPSSHAAAGRHAEAEPLWREFLRRFPAHAEAPEARASLAQGLASMGRFDDAIAEWKAFLQAHPNDPGWQEARAAIPDLALAKASAAFSEKRWGDAVVAFSRFLQEYPDDPRSAEVLLSIASAHREAKDADAMLRTLRVCAEKHRDTHEAGVALLRIGAHHEESGALKEAIAVYEELLRNHPNSDQAPLARERLRALRDKQLEIRSERIVSSREEATLVVATRNIRKLEARAYRVDLGEYFEKKRTVRGIEGLAVDIVKPETQASFDLAGSYEPWRLFRRPEKLPFSGQPGAYVVVAAEEDFTATTLAVVSDLRLVVKASRGHLFAWAFRADTLEPWPGAALAVVAGAEILRATTAADGTARIEDPRISGEARVLAHANGHYAATEGEIPSTASAGYRPTGYVFTDRPLYRPGETVKIGVFLRDVALGRYVVPASRDANIVVRDARGVELLRTEALSDDLGVIEAEARIDAGAPLGEARIEVQCGVGTFAGGFTIAEFRKPEFGVSLEAKSRAARPGDRIPVEVDVRYLAGGPLAGAPLRWAVVKGPFAFDGSRYESLAWFFRDDRASRAAREDDAEPFAEGTLVAGPDGKATISVDTEKEMGDSAYRLFVVATDVDRLTASASLDLFATRQDHFAVLDCALRAVRPEEEFTVSVVTVDAAHRPVGRAGDLEVVDSGRAGAVAAKWPCSTGADGRGQVRLRIPKGGAYLLRFGEASCPILVQGDEIDRAKDARLVADRRHYREGETARLFVDSPVSGVPALLTFEAESVIGHRFVRLDAQSTVLEVPLLPEHAPNVFVTISIPDRTRLLVATDEVVVFRWLDVRVTPRKEAVGPGEEGVFDVETRDALGRPVAAAVAMGIVDDGIYSLADDPARGIRRRFYDVRRTHTIATRSSFELFFPGLTRETNKDLLAEERRRRGELSPEEEARQHVERAKELFRQGDREKAREELRKAVEKDANAIEARELLDADREADKAPPAPGSPAPEPAERPEGGFAEAESKLEEEMESSNDSIGTGGGAAGARRGRGGKKNLRAGGGKAGGDGGEWGEGLLEGAAPRRDLRLTAFFSARSVRTGADGKASVTVRMPESLTTWRSVVRGITADTLVGEAEGLSATRKDLLVRVSAPRFLTDRDECVATTSTHNHTDAAIEASTALAAEGVSVRTAPGGPTPVPPGGVAPIDWTLTGPLAGRARLVAEARAAGLSDAAELLLPVQPYGVPHRGGWAGALRGSVTIPLDLPEGTIPGSVRLLVSVAPTLDGALCDAIAELQAFPYGCVEQTIHGFLPALAAERVLVRMRSPDAARLQRTRESVEEGLRKLLRAQNDDGSFGWWRRCAGDGYVTALALWAAAEARAAGYDAAGAIEGRAAQAIPALAKGLDDDGRCYLQWALAAAKRADLNELNRLFRGRSSLSAPALALLAMAHEKAGLPFPARELRTLLAQQAQRDGDGIRFRGKEGHRWLFSDVEATAYALFAFALEDPVPEEAQAAARWLLRNRDGRGFGTTKETGPSVLALLRLLESRGSSTGSGVVVARLGGDEVARLEVKNGAMEGRGLEIAPDRLAQGRNVLTLETIGDLEVFYTARLDAALKVDGEIPEAGALVRVRRRYLPLAAKRGDEGYSILHDAAEVDRRLASLRRLPAGERMTVEVTVTCREPQSYVIVEDPLPAGFEVLEGHEKGPFVWSERRDDRMVFFAADLQGTCVFTYRVQAVFPGKYAVLAAVAGPMYRPMTHGRSAGSAFEVGEGAGGGEEFGLPTPDEVWARSAELLSKREWKAARDLLVGLRGGPRLKDEILEELLARLLRASLELSDAPAIVSCYEDLRARNPRRLPDAILDLLRLGRAYDDLDQDRIAIGLLRDVVASSWRDEERVASAYAQSGDNTGALGHLLGTDAAYPEDGRASALLRRAADAYLTLRRPDGSAMLAEALDALHRYTARFPEEPTAADAAYRTIEVLSRLQRHERATEEASAFLRRHGKSRFLDDSTLFLMNAQFEGGALDEAGKTAEELRRRNYPSDRDEAKEEPSPFRPAASHLLGKIAHARGDFERAVSRYREAEGIPDAAAALAQLEEVRLEVDPVVVSAPGTPPELPLRVRNVGSVDLRVYPVDLFVLFAVRPSLTDLHLVDLTGIAPVSASTAAFGGAPRYREHRVSTPLPGASAPGAYLVTLKAGNLERSSILLVSDVTVELQRSGSELRVYARKSGGMPAAGALVKVSDGSRIRASGRTDARGVFSTSLEGPAAVVVEREGHYGIARSEG